MSTNIEPVLMQLKATIKRYKILLETCIEGKEVTAEIEALVNYSSTIEEALSLLERSWKHHIEFLNSSEEGKKLSREMCELDCIMSDIQLGVDDEPLP